MADTHGLFWNSNDGDRTYDADSFSEWLTKFFTTGVFNGELQVSASSGLTVSVSSGYANINGKVRFFDTATSITLSAASATNPRIDTIVVERNDTNREITLKAVTGAYSGNSPVPTAPVRSGGVYQLVLAQITVAAGVTSITAANIKDTRMDSTLCGYVTGTVKELDFDQLTAQWTAYLEEYEEDQLDAFETWFANMQGQLSEDAAGNLQNEIDAINGTLGDSDISDVAETVTGAVLALQSGIETAAGTLEAGKQDLFFYSSVSDLSLTTPTVAQVFSTLPVNSMIVAPADELASNAAPDQYGLVEMYKASASAKSFILFHGKDTASGEYKMSVTSNNVPSGTWVRLVSADDIVTQEFSTDNISVSSGGIYQWEKDVTKDGYKPVMLMHRISNASNQGAASSLANVYALAISGNTAKMMIRNTHSSTAKIKVSATVLYVRV